MFPFATSSTCNESSTWPPPCVCSSCLVSAISCLAWWSRTSRPWTRASWRENSPPAKPDQRYPKNSLLQHWSSSFEWTQHVCCRVNSCLFGFPPQIEIGLLLGNSQVIFEKSDSSSMTLVGECQQQERFISGNHGVDGWSHGLICRHQPLKVTWGWDAANFCWFSIKTTRGQTSHTVGSSSRLCHLRQTLPLKQCLTVINSDYMNVVITYWTHQSEIKSCKWQKLLAPY